MFRDYSYEYKKRLLNIAKCKVEKYESEIRYYYLIGDYDKYRNIKILNEELRSIISSSTDEMNLDVVQIKKLLTKIYELRTHFRNRHPEEDVVDVGVNNSFNYTFNFTMTS